MIAYRNNLIRITLCVAITIMLVSAVRQPGAGLRAYYIYVAAESDDEVALVKFDGKNASIEKIIPVGAWPVETEGPHGMTIDPDGEYWYLSMAHGKPYGHVYKYKTGTDELQGRVELGLFPATMQISPVTGLLYVVNFNLHGDHVPSSVSVVDPESMNEIERIQTGVMPHGSRLSPDGLRHYSVAMMSDEVYEIDALALKVTRRLNLNKPGHLSASKKTSARPEEQQHHNPGHHGGPISKPTWVYPHPSRPFIYVASNGADEVVEVDVDAWKVTRRFPTSPGPYNLEVSADGKMLVVTYKSAASTGIWDIEKGEELKRITNSRTISHGVVVSPDNRYAFVSVEGKGGQPGALDVIDMHKLTRITSVDVGKQAGGIAFWRVLEQD